MLKYAEMMKFSNCFNIRFFQTLGVNLESKKRINLGSTSKPRHLLVERILQTCNVYSICKRPGVHNPMITKVAKSSVHPNSGACFHILHYITFNCFWCYVWSDIISYYVHMYVYIYYTYICNMNIAIIWIYIYIYALVCNI
jgi:hypothetical protein